MAHRKVQELIPNSLEWRCVGPYRGGRVAAVAGDISNPMTFYFGCAGGVWKTNDGGTYWENVSDGFFKTSAVGAIGRLRIRPERHLRRHGRILHSRPPSALDFPRRRNVQVNRRGQVLGKHRPGGHPSHRPNPRTPQQSRPHLRVGVLGHLEGPDTRKGVFRSDDGGQSWERVLFRSENAGCNDLWMDPTNPRVIYAATWDSRRSYWNSYNGGPDSRVYRSMDGGASWTDLTDNPGLPNAVKGRIGVTGTAARPGRVWALFDVGGAAAVAALAEMGGRVGGLYRSDDYGETWEHVNDDPEMTVRPHYYNHIFGDPNNPEVIYNLNQPFWKSIDGGRTFRTVELPHYDNHDLWIDPNDSNRMINGNDGGACVTFNGGESWSSIYNQPTGEFYHITADSEISLPPLRHPAGQHLHQRAEPFQQGRYSLGRLLFRRQFRERPHSRPPGQPEHILLRRARQLPRSGRDNAPLRPLHRAGSRRNRLARSHRTHRVGPQIQVRVGQPNRVLPS